MSSQDNVAKYWSGLTWSVGSNVFRLVISIGSSILFLRYLGSGGYGAVVVVADLITLLLILFSLGLGVVQTRELPQLLAQDLKGEAKDFILRTFAFRILSSLVGAGILFLARGWLHGTLYKGVPADLLVVAAVLFPVQMVSTCFRGTLEVTYHQKQVSIIDVASSLVRVLLAIPVIVCDWSVVAFFWTQVAADAVVALWYGAVFRRVVWTKVRGSGRVFFPGKHLSSGIGMMVVLFASSFIGKELDTQLMSFRLGKEAAVEIALYSISFMFASRCLSFVGIGSGGVANLTQAIMSELKIKGHLEKMRNLYESQLCIFYFISTPLVVGGAFLGEHLLGLMYGKIFLGRGLVFGLILAGFGGTVISTLNPAVLYAFRKDKLLIRSRILWGILNGIGSFVLAPKGAAGVALATAVCMYGVAITETIMVWKDLHFNISPGYFVKLIAGSLMMCAAFILTMKVAEGLMILVVLALSGIAGLAGYYVSMMVLKPINRAAVLSVFGGIGFSKYMRWFLIPMSA